MIGSLGSNPRVSVKPVWLIQKEIGLNPVSVSRLRKRIGVGTQDIKSRSV